MSSDFPRFEAYLPETVRILAPDSLAQMPLLAGNSRRSRPENLTSPILGGS